MEKEKCVICGAETPYTIHDHVDLRYWYVEGAGQLCKSCFNNEPLTDETVTISKKLILDTPNDFDLGQKVRMMIHK